MNHIEVVAGIIEYDRKILCMQRGAGKYDYVSFKYEFPGGKVEQGESNIQALVRELEEEMEMKISLSESDHYMTTTHHYPDFTITMHTYLCKVSRPSFHRKEHIDHVWLTRHELDQLDWASADIPIIQKLMTEV